MADENAAPQLAAPSSKTVLIVDDDPVVLSLLEMYVKLEGFNVALATNGKEGTAKCKAKMPDLLITDLRMPGEGGYELLRNLKAEGSDPIPVFIVTAAASTLDDSTISMIKAEANVVEFVHKPIPRVKFAAALHRHLKTKPNPAPPDAGAGGINDRFR